MKQIRTVFILLMLLVTSIGIVDAAAINQGSSNPVEKIIDFIKSITGFPMAITSPAITVTSPNGGETWIVGSTHTIYWVNSGITGNYAKIELWKDGVYFENIRSNISNTGSYTWTIPAALGTKPVTSGSTYKIRVFSRSNSAYSDFSNNYFTINTASASSTSITVTSPNGGENWAIGLTPRPIRWVNSGSPGAEVKIELWKDGVYYTNIRSSVANTGAYDWINNGETTINGMPATINPGSTYMIKVYSRTNSAYGDMSNSYFTIGASEPTPVPTTATPTPTPTPTPTVTPPQPTGDFFSNFLNMIISLITKLLAG